MEIIKINEEYQIFINTQQILINQLQEQTKNNILLIILSLTISSG